MYPFKKIASYQALYLSIMVAFASARLAHCTTICIERFKQLPLAEKLTPAPSTDSPRPSLARGVLALDSLTPVQKVAQAILESEPAKAFLNSVDARVGGSKTSEVAKGILEQVAETQSRSSPAALEFYGKNELENLGATPPFSTNGGLHRSLDLAERALAETKDLSPEQRSFAVVLALVTEMESHASAALPPGPLNKPIVARLMEKKITPQLAKPLLEVAEKVLGPNIPVNEILGLLRMFDPQPISENVKTFLGDLRQRLRSEFPGRSFDWLNPAKIPDQGQSLYAIAVRLRAAKANQLLQPLTHIGGHQAVIEVRTGIPVIFAGSGTTPVRIPIDDRIAGRLNLKKVEISEGIPSGSITVSYDLNSRTPRALKATRNALTKLASDYQALTGKPLIVLIRPAIASLRSESTAEEKRYANSPVVAVQNIPAWKSCLEKQFPQSGPYVSTRQITDPTLFRVITLAPGAKLTTKGDDANYVYVLLNPTDASHLQIGGTATTVSSAASVTVGQTGVISGGQRNATVTFTGSKPTTVLAIDGKHFREHLFEPETTTGLAAHFHPDGTLRLLAEREKIGLDAAIEDALIVREFNSNLNHLELVERAEHAYKAATNNTLSPIQRSYLGQQITRLLAQKTNPREQAKLDIVLASEKIATFVQNEIESVTRDRQKDPRVETQAVWEAFLELRKLPGNDTAEALIEAYLSLKAASRNTEGATPSRVRDTVIFGQRQVLTSPEPIVVGDLVTLPTGGKPLYIDTHSVTALKNQGNRLAPGSPETRAQQAQQNLLPLLARWSEGRTSRQGLAPGSLDEALTSLDLAKRNVAENIALSLYLGGANVEARYGTLEHIEKGGSQKEPVVLVPCKDGTFVINAKGTINGWLHDYQVGVGERKLRIVHEQPIYRKVAHDLNRVSIVAAQELYKANPNQPHIRWLRKKGVKFGEKSEDIEIPPTVEISDQMNADIDEMIDTHQITKAEAIRPARIFVEILGNGTKRYIPVPYRETPRVGLKPVEGIVPFKETLEILANQGFFVLGEPDAIGPRHAAHLGTVYLHDLSHHSMWHQNPRQMAAYRQAARDLLAQGAFYKRTADVRSFEFDTQAIRFLREQNLFSPRLREAAKTMTEEQLVEAVKGLSSQEKLNLVAELTQSEAFVSSDPTLSPLKERALMGLRFTLVLENAFEIDKAGSVRFKQEQIKSNLLPNQIDSQRYTYSQVRDHLVAQSLTDSELVKALSDTVKRFAEINIPIGGMPRDIFQESQRQDQDPQGFGYYAMPSYMAARARALLAVSSKGDFKNSREEMISLLGKLQVVLTEGSRFTSLDWVNAVPKSTVEFRETEVGKFFVDSGVFHPDLYLAAHGGDIIRPSGTTKILTKEEKIKELEGLGDISGHVSEIGAGRPNAIALQNIALENSQHYKMAASDQVYGSLGRDGKEASTSRYTSEERLTGQLEVEFRNNGAFGRKFVLATAAETARENGHAWMGVKAQLTPGGEPVTILLHARLKAETTGKQQQDLGSLGVNLLHSLFLKPRSGPLEIRDLLEGLKDMEIDNVVVNGKSDVAQAFQLIENGLARGIVIQTDPVKGLISRAPEDSLRGKATTEYSTTLSLTRPELKEGVKNSKFAKALKNSEEKPLLILLADNPSESINDAQRGGQFVTELNQKQFKPRKIPGAPEIDEPNEDPESTLYRAQQLNNGAATNTVYVVSHHGPSTADPVDELYNARSVSNLFRHLGSTKPVDENTLNDEVDAQMKSVKSNRPYYNTAALGSNNRVRTDGSFEGLLVIKGRTVTKDAKGIENYANERQWTVSYKIPKDSRAEMDSQLRTLGINTLYAFTRPPSPKPNEPPLPAPQTLLKAKLKDNVIVTLRP